MRITRDKTLMKATEVCRLLNETYWAENRSIDLVEKSMAHSECIAILDGEKLIAFSRVVTDYATMFWLCDVVVDKAYRGHGLGKKMMTYLSEMDIYKPLKGILATRDAHGLYEQYGFKKEPEKYMSKDRGVNGST